VDFPLLGAMNVVFRKQSSLASGIKHERTNMRFSEQLLAEI